MTMADYLSIYLNDHRAGATVGRELSKRAARQNADDEFGPPLARIRDEIAEDHATLERVLDALDVSRDKVKSAGAYAGEKLGRLKLNGQLRGYSPLSRVVELEGLALGVTGKKAMWKALEVLADPRLAEFDFAALADRAERHQEELEALRLRAVELTFAQRPP
jgi:hypothetical protein